MSRIPITGYENLPEGTYVFKIVDVAYNEDFGKLAIKMVTADGESYTESYSLLDKNGAPNSGACNAFSYFAKNALNDFNITEIDHTDLIDHYICAEVVHTQVESTKRPGELFTFVNLGDKSPADGFETVLEAAQKDAPKPVLAKNGKPDLDALLG